MEDNIPEIFLSLKTYLKKDQELREEMRDIVKNMEQAAREIVTILDVIHKTGILEEVISSCKQSREIIEKDVKPGFSKLCDLIETLPLHEYYRYHDSWRYITQRLVFIIALIVYIESGTLASLSNVAETLGINQHRENGFHLDLEDYLMGILQLPSELSRLAVNSVVYGDYKRPVQISKFFTELYAGFRLLNLKNDMLRKRFDALKYDVKKIEEVVYDLSIRGLKSNQEETEND